MKKLSVNSQTMCFENMSENDAEDIKNVAREIVITGKVNFNNFYVKMWLDAVAPLDDNQRFMLATIAMPQWFFVSATGGRDENL